MLFFTLLITLFMASAFTAIDDNSTKNNKVDFTKTPYPRIAMLWVGVRGEKSPEGIARHDLIMIGQGRLGLQPNKKPTGLADGFTPESIETAKKFIRQLRQINPYAVIIGNMLFYEYYDEWLPEDHSWWLRKNGERQQFWPGTHRMDWNNPDYRQKKGKGPVLMSGPANMIMRWSLLTFPVPGRTTLQN